MSGEEKQNDTQFSLSSTCSHDVAWKRNYEKCLIDWFFDCFFWM